MSNQKLYVGNLSWDSDEDTIRQAFARHGEVREVKLITDRETGRPRGFGFVTMGSADDATSAIAAVDGQMIDGREVRVNIAEDRRSGGGGGGGGGGRSGGRW